MKEAPNAMMAVVAKPAGGPMDEAEDSGLPEFMPPQGFEVPEGTKPGDEFQSVASLKVDEDGKLCLLSLDGAEFAGAKEEESEDAGDEQAEDDSEAAPEQPEGGSISSFQDELEQQQRKMKGR